MFSNVHTCSWGVISAITGIGPTASNGLSCLLVSGLPGGKRSLPPSQTWSAQPALEADASLCAPQRSVFRLCTQWTAQGFTRTGWQHRLLLIQLLSVFRCECSCVRPDTLWGSGDDSGASPWGAASPPTAGGQQQHWLIHATGLGSQLETKRRSVLALSHTSQTLPAELARTLPPHSSHTGGGGHRPTVAAAAVCVAGDSAQRGPIRQRGSGNRRGCCSRALPCPTRSSTGDR